MLLEARKRAVFERSLGFDVIMGGPALFRPDMKAVIQDVATIQKDFPDALAFHNSKATIASRGCPVGCAFCIVPAMEGRDFTFLPDFPVRPILCDNNLSALPLEYQDHIIKRYQSTGVPLLDANSGFEPLTFNEEVFQKWRVINRGPWRFAYDETKERLDVLRVMRMLKDVPRRNKRVYVLVGNEPFQACMERIKEVIANDCEPHVQPLIRLNALERIPTVQFDWTLQKLRDVARWSNGWVWKKVPFEQYDRHLKSADIKRRLVITLA